MQGDHPSRWIESAERTAGPGTRVEQKSELLAESSSEEFANVGRLDRILFSIEKREILNALRDAAGQRSLAARALGISRSRLYRRMEALGIDPGALEAEAKTGSTHET